MDYITSHEALLLLKVSRVTLMKYVRSGKIKAVKMNGDLKRPTVMYLEADVRRLAIDKEVEKL